MICNKYHRLVWSFFSLILFSTLSSCAYAEIIDDITVHTDANGELDTVVKFTVPIQYLRHFPQGRSPYTSIFFNVLSTVPADEWQDYETHRTPASDVIQEITVSTRDRGTGPKVHITFYRPADFTVTMGSNNQVLLIHVKPVASQQKNESKPAVGQPSGAATPLAAIPVVVPAIAKAPAVAAPTVAAPTVAAPTVAAPTVTATTAKPVAAIPAPAVEAPVAPSGDITKPNVVLTRSPLKPVHIPLGGKDGLPIFPDIDQAVPQGNTPPTGKLTLADQIMKADNQAAALMEKGGRAMLAGQTFLAIESFNNVLNLPPNKYSEDAQLWIGIARERSGQLAKAILEFNVYLKLYPRRKIGEMGQGETRQVEIIATCALYGFG